ncbi:MAG: hypothetical protein V8T10_10810 [Merdibacter sp.]
MYELAGLTPREFYLYKVTGIYPVCELLWHSGDEADAAEHAGRDEAGAKRKEEKEAGSRKQHRAGADPGKGPKEGTEKKNKRSGTMSRFRTN